MAALVSVKVLQVGSGDQFPIVFIPQLVAEI